MLPLPQLLMGVGINQSISFIFKPGHRNRNFNLKNLLVDDKVTKEYLSELKGEF
jgi:hypothetical protein